MSKWSLSPWDVLGVEEGVDCRCPSHAETRAVNIHATVLLDRQSAADPSCHIHWSCAAWLSSSENGMFTIIMSLHKEHLKSDHHRNIYSLTDIHQKFHKISPRTMKDIWKNSVLLFFWTRCRWGPSEPACKYLGQSHLVKKWYSEHTHNTGPTALPGPLVVGNKWARTKHSENQRNAIHKH